MMQISVKKEILSTNYYHTKMMNEFSRHSFVLFEICIEKCKILLVSTSLNK